MAADEGEPPQHHHVNMTEQDKKLHREAVSPPWASYYGGSVRRHHVAKFIVILLLLAGIIALTLWLVYRPNKPKFRVINAAVYQLNATSPPYVYATMQFTVLMRNPNERVSVYYKHLSAFVEYRGHAVTRPVMLPPLHQKTKSTVAMEPVVGGSAVPVAAEVFNGLAVDEGYGMVGLRLVVTGRVKYKAGGIRTRYYGLYVTCDLVLGLRSNGLVGQNAMLGTNPACRVDV